MYCAIEGGKKLNRICMHCVDRFLAEDSDRRIDMYTDSSSQLSGHGGHTPNSRRLSRKTSSASSSHRSTKRLSDSTHSHSGSTDGGAGPNSPTPMLEAKAAVPPPPPVYSVDHKPQADKQQVDKQHSAQRLHRQASAQKQVHQSQPPTRTHQSQSQPARYVPVPLAPKEAPELINLGVSRYKAKPKRSGGDVDLSYLSNFKSVNARS